ncbi:MAG: YggT family protein [Myxococcota bacterium]|nr:YggT family protein [Myxococcota bacterium]
MTSLIAMFLNVVSGVIIVDAVLSWVQSESTFPRSLTGQLTAPLYAPIRSVLGSQGGMDFSPIILLVVINLLSNVLT